MSTAEKKFLAVFFVFWGFFLTKRHFFGKINIFCKTKNRVG